MIKGRKIIYKNSKQRTKVYLEDLDVKPVIESFVAGTSAPKQKEKTKVVVDKNNEIKEVVVKGGSKMPATIIAILIVLASFYAVYDQFISTGSTNTNKDSNKIYDSEEYIFFENEKELLNIDVNGNTSSYKISDITINLNNSEIYSRNRTINSDNANLINSYTFTDEKNCDSSSSLDEDNKYLESFS